MEVLERLASEHPDDHGGVRTDLIDMIGKKILLQHIVFHSGPLAVSIGSK